MNYIELNKLCKSFGPVEAIHSIDLTVQEGEFVVFVGPSGCGKSTMLRLIAGLEDITSGDLYIGGKRVNDLPPAERGVSMVFQSYALYPHMNVYENMAFGMRLSKTDARNIEERVRETARILQLEKLLERLPKHLSGGQRQRVAIGRALVRNPKVFLLDEPLSNLDAALRVQTRLEIAKLHKQSGATTIYVTHDQVEAMTLANKIVILRDGYLEQVGTPMELYYQPANVFVAGFIGSPQMNFINISTQLTDPNTLHCMTPGGGTIELNITEDSGAHNATKMGIRPEHLDLIEVDNAPLLGEVAVVEKLGDVEFYYVKLPDGQITVARSSGGTNIDVGTRVGINLMQQHIHLFDKDDVAIEQSK